MPTDPNPKRPYRTTTALYKCANPLACKAWSSLNSVYSQAPDALDSETPTEPSVSDNSVERDRKTADTASIESIRGIKVLAQLRDAVASAPS